MQAHYIDSNVKYFRKKKKQEKKNGQVKVNMFWKQQLPAITQKVNFKIL